MEITEIEIIKKLERGVILGYANIVINNSFIIKGIKLIETKEKGRFISMPSKKIRKEKRAFRDVCHPLNQETRDELTTLIFQAYDEKVKQTEE